METRTPAATARTSPYNPALDGLRGICIAAVLLYHLSPSGWFKGGYLGVSAFFTLSGFLITRNLVNEMNSAGRVDVVRFWSRRVQRLAPAALAAITAVVVVTRLTDRGWSRVGLGRTAIAAVWGAANWNNIDVGRTNILSLLGPLGPMWSLAVEEQFYLGIAVLFVVVRGRHAVRNLSVVLVVVSIASVAVAASINDSSPRREFGTDTRAGELALGALLAILASRRTALFTDRVETKRAIGGVCLAVLAAMFVGAIGNSSWFFRGWVFGAGLLTVGVIVALMTNGALSTAGGWAPLVALGRMSYSLYLVHWPIILVTRDPFFGMSGAAAKVVRLGICLTGGWLLHVVVERPARRARVTPGRALLSWFVASLAVSAAAYALL